MHRTLAELEASLPDIRSAPRDAGTVQMLVTRPATDERVLLDIGSFTVEDGLLGDNWRDRGSRRTEDGSANPDQQVTVVNTRFLSVIAGDRSRWPLAGDQLLVDLDLSVDNLPVGQRLAAGSAVFEVTAVPHTGCVKFAARYGKDALRFANSDVGTPLRLRGMYLKVVTAGEVRVGDTLRKVSPRGLRAVDTVPVVEIRDVRPDEHDRVAQLTLAAYDATGHPPGGEYRAVLADVAGRVAAGAQVLVAAIDGQVVGAVTLTLGPNPYFEYDHPEHGDCGFRMLAVDPDAWGSGAGAALTDACLERARAGGRRRMTITSMTYMERAHAMYERRGFERVPELDLRFGGDGTGLAFTKALRPDAPTIVRHWVRGPAAGDAVGCTP